MREVKDAFTIPGMIIMGLRSPYDELFKLGLIVCTMVAAGPVMGFGQWSMLWLPLAVFIAYLVGVPYALVVIGLLRPQKRTAEEMTAQSSPSQEEPVEAMQYHETLSEISNIVA